MKNVMKLIPVMIIAVVISTGCTKKPASSPTANSNASQHNQDVQNTKSESDNSNNEVNTALTNTSGFGKNSSAESFSICGATIDSSHQHDSPNPYLVINYDGQTVCPEPDRIRSGSVKVELVSGTSWVNAGAQVLVTYTNY